MIFAGIIALYLLLIGADALLDDGKPLTGGKRKRGGPSYNIGGNF